MKTKVIHAKIWLNIAKVSNLNFDANFKNIHVKKSSLFSKSSEKLSNVHSVHNVYSTCTKIPSVTPKARISEIFCIVEFLQPFRKVNIFLAKYSIHLFL